MPSTYSVARLILVAYYCAPNRTNSLHETVTGRNPGAEISTESTLNNGSFQAARIAVGKLPTTGVCTLVVPKLTKSAFLLRIFKIPGAEGETRAPYFLVPFYWVLRRFFQTMRFS